MSSRRATPGSGRNVSRSMPGGTIAAPQPDLGEPIAVPAGDRHVAELLAVGGHARAPSSPCRRGSTTSRCPGRRTRGCRASTDASQTGLAVFHHVATLIASSSRERLDELVVVLERARRHLEREPVGRVAEREQLRVVAAGGEPVEVLEDVAVAAADAGVLGHVDDPQPALRRPHRALVEERAPLLPEVALRRRARAGRARSGGSATRGAAAWRAARSRCASPSIPAAQAVVHVLVRHAVAPRRTRPIASSAARLMYMQAPVVPSTGAIRFASGWVASLNR